MYSLPPDPSLLVESIGMPKRLRCHPRSHGFSLCGKRPELEIFSANSDNRTPSRFFPRRHFPNADMDSPVPPGRPLVVGLKCVIGRAKIDQSVVMSNAIDVIDQRVDGKPSGCSHKTVRKKQGAIHSHLDVTTSVFGARRGPSPLATGTTPKRVTATIRDDYTSFVTQKHFSQAFDGGQGAHVYNHSRNLKPGGFVR